MIYAFGNHQLKYKERDRPLSASKKRRIDYKIPVNTTTYYQTVRVRVKSEDLVKISISDEVNKSHLSIGTCCRGRIRSKGMFAEKRSSISLKHTLECDTWSMAKLVILISVLVLVFEMTLLCMWTL